MPSASSLATSAAYCFQMLLMSISCWLVVNPDHTPTLPNPFRRVKRLDLCYDRRMDTKTARTKLGVATDSDLAKALGLTRAAVSYWGGKVPERWQRWVLLLAEKEKPAD